MYLVGIFLLAALIVVSTFGVSAGKAPRPVNDPADKRNLKQGLVYGNTPSDCWAHHKPEGMRDVFIVYPIMPQEVAVNEETELQVQIINTWKQRVQQMTMEVTLHGDPLVEVMANQQGPKEVLDRHLPFSQKLGRAAEQRPGSVAGPDEAPANLTLPVEVPVGAALMVVSLELYPNNPQTSPQSPEVLRDTFDDSGYRSPTQNRVNTFRMIKYDNRYNTTANLTIQNPQPGLGHFEIVHKAGGSTEVPFYLNVTILMEAVGSGGRTYAIDIPKDSAIEKGGAPYTATVKIRPFATGVQKMEFKVTAVTYYKHQDGVTPNEDTFSRFANLTQEVDGFKGSALVPARYLVIGSKYDPPIYGAATSVAVSDQWQLVIGESSGFAAAVLLVPSLLLGGTYGKASRRFFNTILGGAKRRVMFHNLMSLGLSLVALVHIVLFSLEVRYTVLMGMLWGGLGSLSLLVLGLTGYYQVPLIQRHGYKFWRYTHLVFGLLVVLFVVQHAMMDGPDFQFIRDRVPDEVWKFNLSNK